MDAADLNRENLRIDRPAVVGVIGVVDDDEPVRAALSSLMRSAGYKCTVFPSAEEFLASGPRETDCLVLDIRMSGLSGFELHLKLLDMNLSRLLPRTRC